AELMLHPVLCWLAGTGENVNDRISSLAGLIEKCGASRTHEGFPLEPNSAHHLTGGVDAESLSSDRGGDEWPPQSSDIGHKKIDLLVRFGAEGSNFPARIGTKA